MTRKDKRMNKKDKILRQNDEGIIFYSHGMNNNDRKIIIQRQEMKLNDEGMIILSKGMTIILKFPPINLCVMVLF